MWPDRSSFRSGGYTARPTGGSIPRRAPPRHPPRDRQKTGGALPKRTSSRRRHNEWPGRVRADVPGAPRASRHALPSRIASGPTGSPESIRALLRSDPSVIERGFSLFDFDFKTGQSVIIDAIGADRSGRLAIVTIASGDPEAALARLLDGHLWASDQRDLLGRLYSDRGPKGDAPPRGFILAPSFTHAFLRRLSLLSVEITPCLARDIDRGGGTRLTVVEPAAPLFGLEVVERRGPADKDRRDRQPFWPEGVLPSEDTVSRGGIPAVNEAPPAGVAAGTESPATDEEMPWPDTPEERFPWDLDPEHQGGPAVEAEASSADGAVPSSTRSALSDAPAPPGAFEALTDEELDEFERFERQRRERRGRSS